MADFFDERFVLILCIVVYQMDGIIHYAYCIVIQMYFLINKIFLNNIIWLKFLSSCTDVLILYLK